MLAELIDKEALSTAIKGLPVLSELFEEVNGVPKYGTKRELDRLLEGKFEKPINKTIPYLRLLTFGPGEEILHQGDRDGDKLYIAVNGELEVQIADDTGAITIRRLKPGDPFGEMSLLTDAERKATISIPLDAGETQVLEIARVAIPSLRVLPRFSKAIDEAYRSRGFDFIIAAVQKHTAKHFAPEEFARLRQLAEFNVYGPNHVIYEKSTPLDRIYLIKDGWIERKYDESDSDIIGAGNCLGLEWDSEESKWSHTALVKARTEVLSIPVSVVAGDKLLLNKVRDIFDEFSDFDSNSNSERNPSPEIVAKAVQKEVETGIVDARNLLVMDMDKCVRCGNCSLACHKVHGQSRLVRRGISITRLTGSKQNRPQYVLAPQVCIQCKNADCLVDCPTGAIHRNASGMIDINTTICTGCMGCAEQCPYDAIWMVPREFDSATPKIDTGSPDKKADQKVAAKCNLCADRPLNSPNATRLVFSCEQSCPTGALVRVNPREYFDEIRNTLGKEIFRDDTSVIGRNIHKSDPGVRWCHILGLLFALGLTVAALIGSQRHGLNQRINGNEWITIRWLTGVGALFGIVGASWYSRRRRIYARRCLPLRYWRLLHAYFGLAAGGLILVHVGTHLGSWLTASLFLTFALAVVSGLFGALAYYSIPRLMTDIEEEPLLIEDLITRRQQLLQEVEAELNDDELLRQPINSALGGRLSGIRESWGQCLRREALQTSFDKARSRLKRHLEKLNSEQRTTFEIAIDNAVILRRLEALIFLHRVLKYWLVPHIVFAALMTGFLVVHIFQALFFAVR